MQRRHGDLYVWRIEEGLVGVNCAGWRPDSSMCAAAAAVMDRRLPNDVLPAMRAHIVSLGSVLVAAAQHSPAADGDLACPPEPTNAVTCRAGRTRGMAVDGRHGSSRVVVVSRRLLQCVRADKDETALAAESSKRPTTDQHSIDADSFSHHHGDEELEARRCVAAAVGDTLRACLVARSLLRRGHHHHLR